MRFVDLKLRTKLILAFASLIVIALLLSANSIYTMWQFDQDVNALTEEFLPELELASDISNKTQQVAFFMEGYFLNGKSEYYRQAKNELESLKQVILNGERLLEESTQLYSLEQKLSIARMQIPQYEQIMLMAFKTNQDISIIRGRMDESATSYMENCRLFLDIQNTLLKQEIARGGVNDSRRQKNEAIHQLIDIGLQIHRFTVSIGMSAGTKSIDDALLLFPAIEQNISFLKPIIRRDDNTMQLQNIDQAAKSYKELMLELAEKMKAQSAYLAQHQELSKKLVANAIELRDAGVQDSATTSENFSGIILSSITKNIIAVLIAITIAIILAVYMGRLIAKPLYKGIEFAQSISKGDLTAQLDVVQKDEIGELASNLQIMSEIMRQTIAAVTSASDNMANASMELSSTSQHVSQGSSEQASSAEEVSSSIEEMAASILQNTENAKATDLISSKVEIDVEYGKEKVDQTVSAIREIAGKISIIGDIAFQTNILALNAAVEAARAGEHGRGFGVVAAEVGKLAERSKLAALEIDQLSKTSVRSAEEAGELMKQIVPEISRTSSLIREIVAASVQQSAGADQINSAIQQLNLVTQQNAASSEELATNAVELSSQAENLQEIVSFFKVIKSDSVVSRKTKAPTPRLKAAVEQVRKEAKGVILNLDDDDSDEEFERF